MSKEEGDQLARMVEEGTRTWGPNSKFGVLGVKPIWARRMGRVKRGSLGACVSGAGRGCFPVSLIPRRKTIT